MEDIAKNNILQAKFARIIGIIAKRKDISLQEAMSIFYNSATAEMIRAGIADLHCRSDEYLADEILRETSNRAK